MNKEALFLLILILGSLKTTFASNFDLNFTQTQNDSTRIAELDRYWEKLNTSVIEGDFEVYKNCFHQDAVIVFASGKNKTTVPIETALAGWKAGFDDTKAGKVKVNVEFRFSQRIGDGTTAHESGIFIYTATDSSTKATNEFIIPFEMLLVKRDGEWYGLMEYQKPFVTKEEWDALQ